MRTVRVVAASSTTCRGSASQDLCISVIVQDDGWVSSTPLDQNAQQDVRDRSRGTRIAGDVERRLLRRQLLARLQHAPRRRHVVLLRRLDRSRRAADW